MKLPLRQDKSRKGGWECDLKPFVAQSPPRWRSPYPRPWSEMTPGAAPIVAIAAAIVAYWLGGDGGWAVGTGIFVFGVSFLLWLLEG
jgi:hypothetical protein